jgi:amidase
MAEPLDATRGDALGDSDATDLLARLAAREVHPDELRAAALNRAREVDPILHAVAGWVPEVPRTEVVVADGAPLAGLPTLLKDNEPLTGHLCQYGSRAVPEVPAVACSPLTSLMLGLGLDPIARTTMPEFGLTASTETTGFGATRNPWDPDRSVGGSSGGSASLVAAGVVPLAHANDGGGSIRIPSACTGLFGLKPTRGRLPDPLGAERLPVRTVAQGVLTRTVRDTALFFSVAEEAHPALGLPRIGWVRGPGSQKLRIGFCTQAVNGLPVHPETAAAVRDAAALCSALGHEVFEVPPPVDDRFVPDFLDFWCMLAALLQHAGHTMFGPAFDRSATEPVTKGLARRGISRAGHLPGALRRLRRLAREHEAGFAAYDLLLTVVTSHPAPPIGHIGPDVEFRTHLIRLLQFVTMTPVQNISGAPAMSIPMGRTTAGLPIGVQLAAPYGHERRLLEVAYALEEAAPWPLTPHAVTG